jgi:hypothetical protein
MCRAFLLRAAPFGRKQREDAAAFLGRLLAKASAVQAMRRRGELHALGVGQYGSASLAKNFHVLNRLT